MSKTIEDYGTVKKLTPEQIRQAQLVVCDRAEGVEDARELLDELGLL